MFNTGATPQPLSPTVSIDSIEDNAIAPSQHSPTIPSSSASLAAYLVDPSLFTYTSAIHTILVLLYVNDIVLIKDSLVVLTALIQDLSRRFAMKDLGDLHYFLGIEVQRSCTGLFLSQQKYASDLLTKALMHQSKPIATPLPSKLQDWHGSLPYYNPTFYRNLVGGLQYLTLTHPDLTLAVNLVSQHMSSPTVVDFAHLKPIIRYLAGSLDRGIRILAFSLLQLYAFSDVDWAGCKDTRRSTTGYCVFLGSNCVSWSAKKQPTVAHSFVEAEYCALASTSTELTWIFLMLRDIGFSQPHPAILFSDNVSSLHLTMNHVFHART
ncbi:uncharacterized mitochondrial protein AtMg00810-like [Diospyros lotus]|uniref:uncharacterized mitochondrial protein AtMg00810-like n=1 Tax=Diospyros lotus TaxID=55363 RepID=UPI0022511E0B|nr:uncharacterized mitochondrial protein AtMg00810-like [Diospyros lotus]